MSVQSILLPLFVQVALTFAILLLTGGRRFFALRRGDVTGDVAIGYPGWPRGATLAGNALRNQFEVPVLFYVLTILALVTRTADVTFVVLAWLFVLTRIGHAVVHTTSNDTRLRSPIFAVGCAILGLMWAAFAARILFASVVA